MRIIFDRSAFHGDRFESIKGSTLSQLHRRRAVDVYHTPIFLEETLAAYGAGTRAEGWSDHLLYCLDVCSGIFLDRNDIWHNELVVGRGPFARYLMPERASRRYNSLSTLMETLREVATSGNVSQEWSETEEIRGKTNVKKDNQRAISAEVRQTVMEALRRDRVSGSIKDSDFATFRNSELLRTGGELMDLVSQKHVGSLSDQWKKNPYRYPFYTAFVEGFLYAFFYAAVELWEPLDRNAQMDYELLTHLTWADLVVSDDQKFFRRAFDTIWKPRGKRLESAESFAALMNRLH